MSVLKYVFTLILCTIVLAGQAQEEVFYKNYYDDFKPLRSVGDVPKAFTNPSTRKRKSNKNTSKKTRKKSKKEERPQVVTSAENKKVFKEFLQSGHVLFGDTVTGYVTSVLDAIVEPILEEELLEEYELDMIEDVEVYVIRTDQATSFTSHDGIILLSMGLISKLESEAQLAYLLSTEIARYLKYIRINLLPVQNQPAVSAADFLALHNVEDRVLNTLLYPTPAHITADTAALRIYQTTAYSGSAPSELIALYERVKYPYKNIPFDPAWISIPGLEIEEADLLSRTSPIELNKSKFSSPAYYELPVRMAKLDNALEAEYYDSGEDYIVSQPAFNEAVKQARFDVANLLLKAGKYEEAIYHNYLLSTDYESHKYPRLNTAFALSRIAKYKNNEIMERDIKPQKVKGRSQQVHHIMSNYDAEELTVLANKYAWDIWMDDQKDEKLTDLLHDNFFELSKYVSAYEAFLDTSDTDGSVTSEWEPIFRDIVNHELHRLYFKKSFEKAQTARDIYLDKVDQEEKDAQALENIKEKTLNKYKREIAFGLNKKRLLVVTPDHMEMYIDEGEEDNEDAQWFKEYSVKKDRSNDVYEVTKKVFKRLKMRASYLNSLRYLKSHVEKYNDLAAINEYTTELLQFQGIPVASYVKDEINDIRIKYEKDDIAIIGASTVEAKMSGINSTFASGALAFPMISPYFGYKAVQKNYNSYVYAIVIDLEESEIIYNDARLYKAKNNKMNLSQQLYDLIYHIKNPPIKR